MTPDMKAELAKPLDRKHVKPPAPGKYGDYVEGWHVINEANRIFGFDGWGYTLDAIKLTNATLDPENKHHIGYIAQVTVRVGDVARGDVGHGQGHGKSEGDAHDSAVKEAVTDALKRALRTFGNPFGLALYDKSHANVASLPAPKINDGQRDELATLAAAAGVTLQAICKRQGIASLAELPAEHFETVKESLRLTIANKSKQKEAA